jgi:hypothetical protein
MLLHPIFVELLPEIRVFETSGRQLRERLGSRPRITGLFVRPARREIGPERGAIDEVLLLPQFPRGESCTTRRAERNLLVRRRASSTA